MPARREGRQPIDRVNGQRFKTIRDWSKLFQEFWTHQLLIIKARAERAKHRKADPSPEDPSSDGSSN